MTGFSSGQKNSFEKFMDGIDTSYWLDKLASGMNQSGYLGSGELGFSLENLQSVEDFMFAVANENTNIGESIQEVRFWVAAYLGELFIESVGGYWGQNTVTDEYHGYPVVDGWFEPEVYLHVFSIVDAALRRRARGGLVDAISYFQKRAKERRK